MTGHCPGHDPVRTKKKFVLPGLGDGFIIKVGVLSFLALVLKVRITPMIDGGETK